MLNVVVMVSCCEYHFLNCLVFSSLARAIKCVCYKDIRMVNIVSFNITDIKIRIISLYDFEDSVLTLKTKKNIINRLVILKTVSGKLYSYTISKLIDVLFIVNIYCLLFITPFRVESTLLFYSFIFISIKCYYLQYISDIHFSYR